MEFVGRTVRKQFKGFGVFTGVVKSFDSASGFFVIGYDDGDSEEVDLSELTALVEFDTDPSRPNKKPRVRVSVSSNSGNENELCNSVSNAVDSNLDSVQPGLRNDNVIVVNNDNNNSNDKGIDLNLELIEENDLESKRKDLVVEEEDHTVNEQQCLDFNMDLNDDENKDQDADLDGYLKGENTGKDASGDIATRRPVVLGIQSCFNNQTENNNIQSLGKTHMGEKKRGRKRKSLADIPKTPAESVLRRSARRRSMFSGDGHDGNPIKLDDVYDDDGSAVSEDQPISSECKESEEVNVVPPRIELPPSTGCLNLDDLPVLDVFSVYAFLRSFSTILFLSPFELADFVASLRSNSPSLLIDSIHVSLLRTLRKLLEFQSSESSISATNCLRDLNWDLLDLITWPIYMAGYLLMKPGFDLAELKSFKTDYHKQLGSVKLKMLQYICDDVIEMEAISSELNRRILGDPTNLMDPDLNTKLTASKKRKTTMAISGSSCMSEEVIDENVDRNSDECCLCNMDGNLICCDGCPAAYHSKCVGIATTLLPDGDWYCPECVVDKKNLNINVAKAIRGAELLGVDAHGRLYYSTCGYILVSDLGDAETETSYHYYHMNDLTALIDTLKLPNGPYEDISDAITKHWHLYNKIHVEKTKLDSEKPVEVDRTATRKNMSQQLENSYLNFYTFARVASSVAEEWARKVPDNKTNIQVPTKSLEELISIQMKAIIKIPADFFWSNIPNLSLDARKEKCGWCMACKFPTDDGICLFYMNNGYVLENYTSQVLGFDSRIISRNERFLDVMCHILYIEDRLHGLLLGPWLNSHFPKLYRKRFHDASDIAPVKDLLLMLESNIWSRALSDEWIKHVDSVATVGSASHVVSSKLRLPSTRNVVGKKRSKSSDPEPHSSKNASSGVGLFWWRGGRLTRRLFNWKVLPRSLAHKAARQGGGTKIDGILYPENSDFPRRSKVLVWRASVQSAVTVEQLALQIRELDAHIKWEEIENSSHLAKMDKESLKSMRSFKKAIIRRKSSEGGSAKYLLDFGKRRFIPDTVVKHGSKVDDSSSSERKKYWVQEPYVPLFLLKSFEDKRIALKSNKTSSSSISLPACTKNPSKKNVFDYLLSKAEKPENHLCSHCNKEVLIRDAISCQYCEGFFHKRHVKKVGGTYTCIKCHAGNTVKAAVPKKGKISARKTKKVTKTTKKGGKGKQLLQPQANNKGFVVPLRRSARTAKIVSLQSKKKPVKKKKKQSKSGGGKKKQLKSMYEIEKPKGKRGRPKKVIKLSYKKRRSPAVNSIYWLNGLLLSRKPDDERVDEFRSKNHIQRLDSIPVEPPKCSICHEPEFKSWLNYICCDSCKDWFHGDAFGLKDEHIGVIIGFKCHKCRERPVPICSHLNSIGEKPKSSTPKSKERTQYAIADVANATVPLEQKPIDAEPMSGSEENPKQNGPMPVVEEDPRQNVPASEPEDDTEQNGPAPGSEEDPIQNGPAPVSEDPGRNGPAPGSEDPGQNGPMLRSVEDPGQNGLVPVSEEDPGQNGSLPVSGKDPEQNGSVPVSDEDPGQNGPVPGSAEDPGQNGPVFGFEEKLAENGPDLGPALPLVEVNGSLKANTSVVD